MALSVDDLKAIKELVVSPVELKLTEFREDLNCHLAGVSTRIDGVEKRQADDEKRITSLETRWGRVLLYGGMLVAAITFAFNFAGEWLKRKLGLTK